MPSSLFEVPTPVKVLLTSLFTKADPYDSSSKLVVIAASERRDQVKALTDLLKPYAPLELDITDHNGFKRVMARIQWKERLDIVIRLPRRLDFRSEAYYDLTKLVNESIHFGIRNLILIGTWETEQDAPKSVRDLSHTIIELHSWGYSIKVNE